MGLAGETVMFGVVAVIPAVIDASVAVSLGRLRLDVDLQVGAGSIDLTFERQDARVAVHSNSRGPRLRVSYD